MRIEDGALVTDKDGDSPGRYGDSCFHTSAFALSHFWLTGEYHPQLNLDVFFTPTGTVRNPKSIWRQNDMSEDQEKPLFMFMRETCNTEKREFIYWHCFDDFKTGNNRYITWGYFAELQNIQWLRCVCLVVQVLFFWFPWYWNDGQMKNLVETARKIAVGAKIEKLKWYEIIIAHLENIWAHWPIGNAWKKTDGYLQWALCARLAPYPFRKLIRLKTLKNKISLYYAPEGAAGLWVVEKHHALLEKFFK